MLLALFVVLCLVLLASAAFVGQCRVWSLDALRMIRSRAVELGACVVCFDHRERVVRETFHYLRVVIVAGLLWRLVGGEWFIEAALDELRKQEDGPFRCSGHTCRCGRCGTIGGSRFAAVTGRLRG